MFSEVVLLEDTNEEPSWELESHSELKDCQIPHGFLFHMFSCAYVTVGLA